MRLCKLSCYGSLFLSLPWEAWKLEGESSVSWILFEDEGAPEDLRLAEGLDLFILVFYPSKNLLVDNLEEIDMIIETWSPRGWKYSGTFKEKNQTFL